MPFLTGEHVQKFKDEGYLVVPDFYSQGEVKEMLDQAKKLIEEFDIETHPMTAFTTSDNGKHVGDKYFLDSNDKISFFLEPSAISPDDPTKLVVPKQQSVNKIGHALAQLDPVFRRVTLENPRMVEVARDLGEHEDPRVLQSMIICKQPRIGGKVPIHNDSTFLYTDPPSALGFWIALEDCTHENGALSFLPGSHLRNTLTSRFIRLDALPDSAPGTTGTGFIPLDSAPKDGEKDFEVDWEKQEGWKEEACKAGSLVLIHGSVQHASPPNHSEKTRFIYTFHMVEGGATYDEKNWLQPTKEMPFAKLFP